MKGGLYLAGGWGSGGGACATVYGSGNWLRNKAVVMDDCVLFFQGSLSSGWSYQGQSGLTRKPLIKENGREASVAARSTRKAWAAPKQPSRSVTKNSGRIYDRKYMFQ